MLFFDLEFYVPKADRNNPKSRGTLVFNPTYSNHLLLGGSFYSRPLMGKEFLNEHHLWLWDFSSPKKLLMAIPRNWWTRQQNWESILKLRD